MSPANVHLNLQRQLFARSERVKGIDFHPTEPWVSVNFGLGAIILWFVLLTALLQILTTLYSGMCAD